MAFFGEANAFIGLTEKFLKLLSWLGAYNHNENLCDDYYYQEYNKKLYIKKNGDGLIVSSFILKIIDPLKVDGLVRTLDIHDAKRDSKFDDFEEMKATPICDVFSRCGFWYRSDNDIVTDVEEFYEDQDISKKSDDKYISIKLNIDTSKLEKNRTYHLSYAFSVPGLFPVANGRFDLLSMDRADYKDFRSYISAEHMGHHLRFSAYFEDGIEFKEKPKGHAILSEAIKKRNNPKAKTYTCVYKNNIFYHKYHFEVENPQEYSSIYMRWNLKNPQTQKMAIK